MSSVTTFHTEDRNHLFKKLHEPFNKNASRAAHSSAAASFLMIGALIVITCASLCFALPGINVISDVFLPGILPGLGSIALSIPLIIFSVRRARNNKPIREELIDFNIMLFNWYAVYQMEEEQRVSFIKENFFKPNWSKEYCSKLIGDIKKRYPKKPEDESPEKNLLEALDEVLKKIYKDK